MDSTDRSLEAEVQQYKSDRRGYIAMKFLFYGLEYLSLGAGLWNLYSLTKSPNMSTAGGAIFMGAIYAFFRFIGDEKTATEGSRLIDRRRELTARCITQDIDF